MMYNSKFKKKMSYFRGTYPSGGTGLVRDQATDKLKEQRRNPRRFLLHGGLGRAGMGQGSRPGSACVGFIELK